MNLLLCTPSGANEESPPKSTFSPVSQEIKSTNTINSVTPNNFTPPNYIPSSNIVININTPNPQVLLPSMVFSLLNQGLGQSHPMFLIVIIITLQFRVCYMTRISVICLQRKK